ncbi:MAG: TetR/AcrR family transcriptional regulator [Pseudomonadota bacterium]
MVVLLEEGALRKLPHQARSTERVISILDAATKICLEQDLDQINTAAVANQTNLPIGTVYQFFENREAVIRALVVRANYQTTQLVQNVIRENGAFGNWLTDGAAVWDHYVEIFLQNEELVATIRKVGHLRVYQETSQRRFAQALDTFLQHMEQVGIQPTPSRKRVALFCLHMSNYLRHMVIAEEDPEQQKFLREQIKIMMTGYLMPAMLQA